MPRKLFFRILKISVLLLFCIGAVTVGVKNALPSVKAAATAEAVSRVHLLLNKAFSAAREKADRSDYIFISSNGEATESIEVNTELLNTIKTEALESACISLSPSPLNSVSVPIGSFTGSALLFGKGFGIPFGAFTSPEITAEYRTEFLSAGINGILHRIILNIKATLYIELPGDSIERFINADFILAETVITGQIPDIIIDRMLK